MAGHGTGHGKIILFGEHFVVHGAPAIACGISNAVVVDVERAAKNRIISKQKVVEEYSLAAIANILASMGVRQAYEVTMTGDLATYGGLGSSAAFCVALVHAIADDQDMQVTKAQANAHAYEGEKAFHGNPSGIDNIVATYGGVLEFRRGRTPLENRFERIEVTKPLDFVVSFSGKYSPTAKMVDSVRRFKEEDREEFGQLMDEYMTLAAEGRKDLEKGRLDKVGTLMNANQVLLAELGVSDESNDRIIEMALKEGALGSKVTGGGGGGCCISLARDKAHAEALAKKLTGFESFCTQVTKESKIVH